MDYNYILNDYVLIEKELLEYGFKKEKEKYVYKKDIYDSFYVLIKIFDNIDIKVYDKELNEEYLPFKVNNYEGTLTYKIYDCVDKLLNDILSRCFYKNDIKERIIKYANENHNALIENPWEKSPLDTTFKERKSNKWYAIILNVPYRSLGVLSDQKVDIMNVKNDPDVVLKIIDNKTYFKAYHMNKKHWITIILDKNVNFDVIKTLMDESYEIIKKHVK